MAHISRLYDFQAGTKIVSAQVDAELNQLVSAYNDNEDNTENHKSRVDNPHTVTKTQVGLGNADNTADVNKPVSTAQATAIGVVQTDLNSHKSRTDNPHTVTKTQVGLGNVDNTSDANKPVSTAQNNAINTVKANLNTHANNANNPHSVSKLQVGLGSVDDTSDMAKPVSMAQAIAIAVVHDDLNSHKSRMDNPHSVTAEQVGLDIVDNLTTNDATKVLSAKQGKYIKDNYALKAITVNGQALSVNNVFTATTSTAPGTAAKTIFPVGTGTITPEDGTILAVMFTSGNTANSITMKLPTMGSYVPVIASSPLTLLPNVPYLFVYSTSGGKAFHLVSTTKANVGLYNVDNTSDADKPISTAVAAALGVLASLTTDEKTNLVGAISEVDAHTDANAAAITALDTAKADKLKVASIEHELNTCKSVLSNININNEATQDAKGYGVVSLPKNAANGHMGVKVEGVTATNLVTNGNFANGTTGWAGLGTFSSAPSVSSGVLSFTGSAQCAVRQTGIGTYTAEHKWYVSADVKADSNLVNVNFSSAAFSGNAHSGSGEWEKITGIFSYSSSGALDVRIGDSRTSGWSAVYTKNILVVNLTTTFGAGNEPTVEQCDAMFANWFDGTKSVQTPLRITSVGKNLFDKNKVVLLSIVDSSGNFVSSANHRSNFIQLKAGTYRISGRTASVLCIYDKNKSFIFMKDSQPFTLTQDGYIVFNILSTDNINVIQLELGSTATTYEPYKESSLYLPDVGELRSLPNGVADTIEDGVKTQRTNKKVLQASDVTHIFTTNINNDIIYIKKPLDYIGYNNILMHEKSVSLLQFTMLSSSSDGINNKWNILNNQILDSFYVAVPKDTFTSLTDAKNYFANQELTYQLAEPIITPIPSSGTLVSFPSGTVYVEKAIADAGIYDSGITVLNTDKPISTLESLSKIDFATGQPTPLNVSTAVVAGDGLSFTHTGLSDGDIAFFTYLYDEESTEGEATVTYYDSRYVIKNEDDGKFYQWAIKASGTPPTATIELEEV